LSEHPILGEYVGEYLFTQVWLLLLYSTIYLWLLNYIIELKQTTFNKKIESNSFQISVFKGFLKELLMKKSDRYKIDGFLIFSKADLINFLSKSMRHKYIKGLTQFWHFILLD